MRALFATAFVVYLAAVLGAYSLYGNDGITLTVGIPAIFLFTFLSIAWPVVVILFIIWIVYRIVRLLQTSDATN